MTDQETALAALQNLASCLDTTARIMRKLGSPYRKYSLLLSEPYEMVDNWAKTEEFRNKLRETIE